ncbi:ImmA/IrrE family metallo-endopeptidase [Treponema zuelzerae]|uniref:ImmA/IrrE family metallo-endopeptidase n=1 Tax=Teretinema zuelzerae TaxID=156 RepID=A0AAE3JHN9_9SPIR|nr:ImmA/IrrE family metallo-endopeptidase [Teretinema zuelzerae]MCD1654117.1 ImmA/IrrE family metallo-endopeptidase [Teretinema zuelzerae]
MKENLLSPKECLLVRDQANGKLASFNKQNDILGEQVFEILNQNCRILFYPLEDEDVWGFFEKIHGKSFVCINTSIDFDNQVFTAAHELYHLWFNHGQELILASELEERTSNIPKHELMANRFAAEFLVPELLLRQEIRQRKIDNERIDVNAVVRLARVFLVPYRTMAKRLAEIDMISASQCRGFLALPEDEVYRIRKRLGIELIERSNKISLDNLIDNTLSVYEKGQISREKLEYLLAFANITPADMGISDEERQARPSDDELDSLMED